MAEKLLILLTIAGGISLLAQFVGASIYDIRQVQRLQERQRQPGARRYRHRPTITIIVLAENSGSYIFNCLESIRKNGYRKYNIVVADNASTDVTQQIVRRYKVMHPKVDIRLYAKKMYVGHNQLIRDAIYTHAKGDYVFVLPASSTLRPTTIMNAVRYTNDKDSVEAVAAARRSCNHQSLTGICRSYTDFLIRRWYKLMTILAPMQTELSENTLYKRDAARRLVLNRMNKRLVNVYRAEDVIVEDRQGLSPKDFLLTNWNRKLQMTGKSRLWFVAVISTAIAIVCTPIVLAYALQVALGTHQPSLLIVCWSVITIVLVSSIWDEQGSRFTEKLRYTLGMPVAYGMLYLLACIKATQSFVQLGRIIQWRIKSA